MAFPISHDLSLILFTFKHQIEIHCITLFHFFSFPAFKQNVQAAPIRAVDVYNLMCWTLGVEPLPNNGSWSRVEYLLSGSSPVLSASLWMFWMLLGMVLIV